MQAVILAGGLGTRLRPLTLTTPKPLIPVFGKPVLVHQIELLKKHGINHVILCLNYRAADIKKYFNGNPVKGVKIDCVVEPNPLGTAGAVKNAEPYIVSDFFLVLNGDVLMDADIGRIISFHARKRAKAVLLLKEVSDPSRYGLVLVDSRMRIQQFLEKPSFEQMDQAAINTINAGLYVMRRDILKMIPPHKFFSFERDVFPALLLKADNFFGMVQKFYWIDIGTPEKYFLAHEDILRGDYKIGKKHSIAAKNIRMGNGVELSGTVFIGDQCVIENKAKIKDCILFSRVKVGESSMLKNCIIGNEVQIYKNAFVENAIIGDKCVISGVRGM